MNEILKQKIVMAMDMKGWEQDGNGLDFVNIGGDGKRKSFSSWEEVLRFCVAI